ncbi:MAG: hypothetical protein NWF07_00135 [Candidatus Bathyarchaeota archaeon]|nr:hypothetical protein [Candidatus Bathyarchaeota archaeon]
MRKRVKVDRTRLERFKFTPLTELKATIEEKPELSQKLRVDFAGTLKAQGITIDEAFKHKLSTEWRAAIKQDIRKVAEEHPESKNWYLKRVLDEKPIKLKVKIDPETGEKTKTLRRS